MATKYLKLKPVLRASQNSDYSNPEWPADLEEQISQVAELSNSILAIGTGAETLSWLGLTDIVLYAVYNKDASNYVTATYRLAGAGANTTPKIKPGRWLVVSDLDTTIAPQLQANGAACDCRVIIAGN